MCPANSSTIRIHRITSGDFNADFRGSLGLQGLLERKTKKGLVVDSYKIC
jgi:hypothetical protein